MKTDWALWFATSKTACKSLPRPWSPYCPTQWGMLLPTPMMPSPCAWTHHLLFLRIINKDDVHLGKVVVYPFCDCVQLLACVLTGQECLACVQLVGCYQGGLECQLGGGCRFSFGTCGEQEEGMHVQRLRYCSHDACGEIVELSDLLALLSTRKCVICVQVFN